jgi:hypothetical protein
MKRTVLGVGPLLAGMVAKGLVTVEQLDVPTPRWQAELPLMTEYRVMGGRPVPEVPATPARGWADSDDLVDFEP